MADLSPHEIRAAYDKLSDEDKEYTGLENALTCYLCETGIVPSEGADSNVIWPYESIAVIDGQAYHEEGGSDAVIFGDEEYQWERKITRIVCDQCIGKHSVIDSDDDEEEYDKWIEELGVGADFDGRFITLLEHGEWEEIVNADRQYRADHPWD